MYINDATTPFVATDVPAIPQYEQLFDTYLPNGLKTASLGLNSFAAWLLFAQSAKACGDHDHPAVRRTSTASTPRRSTAAG